MNEPERPIPTIAFTYVVLAIAAASVPVLVDAGAIARAAELYPMAASARPYWVPEHFALLYVRAPLVAVSACVLLLAPGLITAFTLDVSRSFATWIVAGFALSILIVSAAAGTVQWIIGRPLVGDAFAATVAGCAAAAATFTMIQVSRGSALRVPWGPQGLKRMLAAFILPPFLLVAALVPKLFWESLNGDGAHTIGATLLLLRQPVPFFPADAGPLTAFPGITSFIYTYPGSWFVRLFGDLEASVRLPFILYLGMLFSAIVAFAELRQKPLRIAWLWLIWLGLLVYSVTMSFSATYSPYSADIALPATQDTLLIALMLSYVLFFLEERAGWMTLSLVMVYASLPNGTMLVAIWVAAAFIVKPASRRMALVSIVALAACILLSPVAAAALEWSGLPVPGGEYGVRGILRYFAFLRLDDWRRLAFLVVPAGILPAVYLLNWKRQDVAGRALTLTIAAYFALFYVQASVALHHFVPGMVLPLAVFWRQAGATDRRNEKAFMGAVVACALAALVISLPSHARPFTEARLIGESIENRTEQGGGGERISYAGYGALRDLFPPAYDSGSSGRTFQTAPLVLQYYSQRHTGQPSYILQWRDRPAPAGTVLVSADSMTAIYAVSDSILLSHRSLRPPEPAGSPVYQIANAVLFRTGAMRRDPHVIDVARLLGHLGLDVRRPGGGQ